MKLIYPNVEKWIEDNHVSHVAKCARVCYASETDSELSNRKLYNSLINKGHTSMLRHESRYFIVKKKECVDNEYKNIYNELTKYTYCDYIEWCCINASMFITLNGDFYNKHRFEKLVNLIRKFEVDRENYVSNEIGFYQARFTFCVTTQISTSRELNRTSPNNIAEQSTRYVNFDKKGGIAICLPHWWDDASGLTKGIFKAYWKWCERTYNFLLKIGFKPEDARGVLPLDTATKVVYTYTIKEWMHILNLRYFETTGKAHPNAKIIGELIYNHICEEGYDIKLIPTNY